jgi:hypothetical protein
VYTGAGAGMAGGWCGGIGCGRVFWSECRVGDIFDMCVFFCIVEY